MVPSRLWLGCHRVRRGSPYLLEPQGSRLYQAGGAQWWHRRLDGGQVPLDKGEPAKIAPSRPKLTYNQAMMVGTDELNQLTKSGKTPLLIDARPEDFFLGEDASSSGRPVGHLAGFQALGLRGMVCRQHGSTAGHHPVAPASRNERALLVPSPR